jgi:hypothetical protein
MTTTRYWITDEPWPASEATAADAHAAGAEVILHGIPPSLAGTIPTGIVGYYEVVRPDPPPFAPLDSAGALSTLLVVVGTLDLDDAAHAVGASTDHLVHEATAWSLGA